MNTGLRILRTEDCDEWTAILQRCVKYDFHHLPQYHRFAERRGEGVAHLFAYQQDDYIVSLPLLLRPVEDWQDATSVYGYCGPVASHENPPNSVVRDFQAALREAFVERRVIAVFSRMHPLISQREWLTGLGDCPADGQTISIDLTRTTEYKKSCRGNIRKLHRLGFTGLHDTEKRYLPEFVDIYLETMRRVEAQHGYHFDADYFKLLVAELGPIAQLFVALHEGKVVAASLATICNGIVQDHLGGTRNEFLKFSPDRLVVDAERQWATEIGAHVLHLGGGVGAQEDSVFRYKSAFSDRRHAFGTWRWVVQPAVYEPLCELAVRSNEANGRQAISDRYFPQYRCPTDPRCMVLRPAEKQEWMRVLEQCAHHDFYHLPEYHQIEENRGGGAAHLFVYRESEHVIALPLLLRPVDEALPDGWKDATSVYGYGGPVASSPTMPEQVVWHFQTALRKILAEHRIVAVFSRLHPLLGQPRLLEGLGECTAHGQTVSIDLTLPLEQQRAAYRRSFRTRINKLQRNGVVCVRDEDKRHLPEFVSIYHETMRRVDAYDSYFFDENYFTALADALGSKLQLFVVMADGQVAAGGLFTICDGIAQYHLGGTRDGFLSLSPTGLMFDTVRLWAHESGARVLHLGGGVGSKDDSLFHFKSGFSDRRHAFSTWRWIIVPEVYRKLCERVEDVSSDFFPAYRCPATPRAAVLTQ